MAELPELEANKGSEPLDAPLPEPDDDPNRTVSPELGVLAPKPEPVPKLEPEGVLPKDCEGGSSGAMADGAVVVGTPPPRVGGVVIVGGVMLEPDMEGVAGAIAAGGVITVGAVVLPVERLAGEPGGAMSGPLTPLGEPLAARAGPTVTVPPAVGDVTDKGARVSAGFAAEPLEPAAVAPAAWAFWGCALPWATK